MNRVDRWIVLSTAAPALIGILFTPISSASTVASPQQKLVAMQVKAAAPLVDGASGADSERRQVALLVSADAHDISRTLPSGFPSMSVQSSFVDLRAMGLQLPEPGPLSAILATLALAGFVMIRRIV